MWFYICACTMLVMSIIAIVIYVKSGDVSKLDSGVVEMLQNSRRRPFEQREEAKLQNSKRVRMNMGLLGMGMIPCFVLMFFGIFAKTIIGERIAEVFLVVGVFIAFCGIATVLLLWKDTRKLAQDKEIYVVKAYLMGVKQGRSVRTAVLAYYDYLQNKCVSVNATLDGKDVYHLQGLSGGFVEILVAEKKGKVKYVYLYR